MEAVISQHKTNQEVWGPAALEQRRERGRQHLAAIALRRASWIKRNRYYYELLTRLLRFLVEPNKRVLSVGCGPAYHLAAVRPKEGKGIDISPEMVDIARQRNPCFEFAAAFPDKEEFRRVFEPGEKFDYILFNNIGDTVDVLQALRNLRPLCLRHTRLLVETYNHLWEPLVAFAEWAGMKVPRTEQNWLSMTDIRNLMKLAGFEALETHRIVILPKYVPLLSAFFNRFCARLPLLKRLCMTQVVVGRLLPSPVPKEELSVSVIVPCRNEKGNVEDAAQRILQLGRQTEIIFCDDQSTDGTAEEVLRVQSLYPGKDIRLERGPGACKSRNVWTGFDTATSDILMILDADLTTIPEELPYFMDVIASGQGEFINGSWLVYPVPKGAMTTANMLGNKIFQRRVHVPARATRKGYVVRNQSPLEKRLGTNQTDAGKLGNRRPLGRLRTAIWRRKIESKDPGSARTLPSIYGSTKMTRVFRNGLVMLKMCWHGFLKLKLGY